MSRTGAGGGPFRIGGGDQPSAQAHGAPAAKMRVLIGGGTGFIGRALTQRLLSRGHEVTVVSRQPGAQRITWSELTHSGLPHCEAVVNLAGENILNPFRRWTEAYRKDLLSSRLDTTHILATAIAKATQPPQVWVLVTGTAYYQPSLTAEYDEDSPGGNFDFFSNLVSKWEAAAKLPGDATRQVVVRSGAVLGRGGGAISHMLLPFRLGLGGPIGSGRQFFPWIHIEDISGILVHAIENGQVNGILNGVSPASSTTNAEFAKALGAALGRPAFLPLPSPAVQAVFGRERAVMLLEGQKVIPRRTLASGYQYVFPELGAALKQAVS
ncbi:epimerase family protein SDR39U1 isoform X2 [Notamacropus eugenii]|uniref:epimerase family protein SDR39U1 isoform X2 n=1 Tax=Notamacropus eugenii TaxID=9315 RepID=UPI003B67B3D1